MKEKNYSIEFLRVVFTIYIVLRHTLAATGIWPSNCLWLGVEFFFVLSGFLLTLTFQSDRSIGSYVISRYIRFAPLTIFGCVLCALFTMPNPLSLIANVFLISETGIVVDSGATNPPTWYLSVLLWGGVIYFMLLRIDSRLRNLALAIIVSLGLSSLRKCGYEPVFGELGNGIISHRFIRGFIEMGLGSLSALWFVKYRAIDLPRKFVSVLEMVALAIALLGPFAPIWHHPNCISVLVLDNALLVMLFVNNKGFVSNVLNKPYWGTFSQYALALYCTHYLTTLAIYRFHLNVGVETRVITCCGAVVVSTLLSVLARKFVEIPCANMLCAALKTIGSK